MAALGSPERRARAADSLSFRWRSEPGLGAAAAEALWVEARALDEAGRPADAADRLDELLSMGGAGDELSTRAAADLSRLRVLLGRHPEALRVLAEWPGAGGAERRDRVREAAAGMSAEELADGPGLFPGGSVERGIVATERARALALSGRPDAAREAALAALDGELPDVDRETARAVADGEVDPDDRPVPRIGLVLPLSGELESVGRLLREAAVLAVDGDPVELVVRDDSSRAETVPEIVRELERDGATAVVGPVTSDGFRAAVEARSDPSLAVVSPAASSVSSPSPNAYTLWERRARVRDVSRALGEWIPSRTGLRRLGVLRPASAAGRAREHGFRSGARRGGGWVAVSGTFDPDSTTYSRPVSWLAANRPESLLVGAGDSRTVLQMAPQLSYYGLRSALVAGTSAWGEPITVRRLSGDFPSLWVSAVFTDRTERDTAWTGFRSAYEQRYRRGVPSGALPSLAYDAVRWTAGSLGPGRLPRRGVLSRGLVREEHVGASGRFSARRGASTVEREARIRMATGGEIVDADTAALHSWRRKAERLVEAGRRQRRGQARSEVGRWMEQHGDSVRVDSARILERERRLPEADSLPAAAGDTAGGGEASVDTAGRASARRGRDDSDAAGAADAGRRGRLDWAREEEGRR